MDKDKVIGGYDSMREGVEGAKIFIIFYLPTFDLVGKMGYMSFLGEVGLCIDMSWLFGGWSFIVTQSFWSCSSFMHLFFLTLVLGLDMENKLLEVDIHG
jgi:hypothetical protein